MCSWMAFCTVEFRRLIIHCLADSHSRYWRFCRCLAHCRLYRHSSSAQNGWRSKFYYKNCRLPSMRFEVKIDITSRTGKRGKSKAQRVHYQPQGYRRQILLRVAFSIFCASLGSDLWCVWRLGVSINAVNQTIGLKYVAFGFNFLPLSITHQTMHTYTVS